MPREQALQRSLIALRTNALAALASIATVGLCAGMMIVQVRIQEVPLKVGIVLMTCFASDDREDISDVGARKQGPKQEIT